MVRCVALTALWALLIAAPAGGAVPGMTHSGFDVEVDSRAHAGCTDTPGAEVRDQDEDAEVHSTAPIDLAVSSAAAGTCPDRDSDQDPPPRYAVSSAGSAGARGRADDHAGSAFVAQGTASAGGSWSQQSPKWCCTATIYGDGRLEFDFTLTDDTPYQFSGTASRAISGASDGLASGHVVLYRSEGSDQVPVARVLSDNKDYTADLPPLETSGTLGPGSYSFLIQAGCADVSNLYPTETCVAGATGRLQLGVASDRDGDALPDEWETNGLDADDNGTIDLDLPALGANPDHKDVFVELDAMAGRKLDQAALDSVIAAFKAAPVANPDGVPGISLHIDASQANLPADTSLSQASGTPWNWTTFDAVKAANMESARRKIFHYAVSAVDTPDSPGGMARGQALDDIAGSDFLLLMPPWVFGLTPEAFRVQAGTFMHELGHNLGLLHGGSDSVQYKPNYLSVMNYTFQASWLVRGTTFALDYSRFEFGLDESTLDEELGFNLSSGPSGYTSAVRCPGEIMRPFVIGTSAVDWNCDQLTAVSPVFADVNLDGSLGALAGHLDWPALRFDGGEVGEGARTPLTETPSDEPPFAEVLAAASSLTASAITATAPTPPPAVAPLVRVTARLSGLKITPRTLRAARSGATLVKRLPRRRGAQVTFRLDRIATVHFSVQRRRGSRWVTQPGSFSVKAQPGVTRLRFSGRLRKRALAPGAYRLIATPAGGVAVHAPFRVR